MANRHLDHLESFEQAGGCVASVHVRMGRLPSFLTLGKMVEDRCEGGEDGTEKSQMQGSNYQFSSPPQDRIGRYVPKSGLRFVARSSNSWWIVVFCHHSLLQ
jgi:hypothetical protein